jgi:hypothetical protein
MYIHSDDEIAHFRIGDVVKVVGASQRLRIIEKRESVSHVNMETERRVYYKCEWKGRDGVMYSGWYEQSRLERGW